MINPLDRIEKLRAVRMGTNEQKRLRAEIEQLREALLSRVEGEKQTPDETRDGEGGDE